jgi:hypothetical protein
MHTSDESDPSETKGRDTGPSNTSAPTTATGTATNTDAAADSDTKAEPARCGAILRRTGDPCKNYAIKGGRCRWHVVDEVVPADEREALRQLQEAAAQHALDAFHAVEGGGMASVVRAVEKAAIDLADLRETLAFLKGNRKAAFAWGGLFLSLVGGVIGAIVTALIDRR